MMHAQFLDTVQATRSSEELDRLSRAIWLDTSLSEESQDLMIRSIATRRKTLKGQGASRPVRPKMPVQRARDPKASVLRRRQLAFSGPMPPAMAAQFTTAELASLKIVADEIRAKGICSLVLDAIAARAGVSKRSVQNAMRRAAQLGFITITHRRLRGQLKNLPNQIRIIAVEWLSWLKVARASSPRITSKYQRQTYAQNHRARALPTDQAAVLRRPAVQSHPIAHLLPQLREAHLSGSAILRIGQR